MSASKPSRITSGLELDIQLAHGIGLIERRVVELGLIGIQGVGEQWIGRLAGAP